MPPPFQNTSHKTPSNQSCHLLLGAMGTLSYSSRGRREAGFLPVALLSAVNLAIIEFLQFAPGNLPGIRLDHVAPGVGRWGWGTKVPCALGHVAFLGACDLQK